MTELIRIEEKEGIQTVNARELHEFLEVGRDFSNWIKQRIEKYDFVENQDFAVIAGIGENRTRSEKRNLRKSVYLFRIDCRGISKSNK